MSEIIEGKPVLDPGVCFICEMSNPVRYIDTLRDFAGIVREKLDGRKYLCEECIEDAAKKLGFVTPKEHEKLQAKYVAVCESEKRLVQDLAKFSDLKAVIDHFGGSQAVKVAVSKK